VLSHLKSS